MPSSRTYRIPMWVPCAAIAISVVVIIFCVMHLGHRMKARWPW